MTREKSNLKKILLPGTDLGRKSVIFTLLFFVFFLIFRFVVLAGYRGGDTFFSQPALSIPISIAGIFGVLAFITGIFSVITQKERSVSVFISILWGAFVFVFILGEFVSPH